jgi:hypothetical protein
MVKTKNITGLIVLALMVPVIGMYACNSTSTVVNKVSKPNNSASVTTDLRNKSGILKTPVSGKINKTIVDDNLKVKLSDYSFSVGADEKHDGSEAEHAQGDIEITGLGKHQIKIDEDNYPVMSNQEDVETITDETTGNIRIYTADQDLQRYSISDGKTKLIIEINPDGTWSVDGNPAKTVEDVAKLAMQSPLFSEASPHGIALMYELFENYGKIDSNIEIIKTLATTSCNTGGAQQLAPGIGNPEELLKAGLMALEEKNLTK